MEVYMELPLKAEVVCTDGACGISEFVLYNPVLEQITHLVVKEDVEDHPEFILPLDLISESTDSSIHVTCSRAEFEKLQPFVITRFIKDMVPDYAGIGSYGMGSYFYWPYVKPDTITVYETVNDQQIPEGEMTLHRGSPVEATDGPVGTVGEFVVDPRNGKITHLVMREGHLWGKKDVIVPLSVIGDTRKGTIFLKLDKHEIESLSTFPINRHYALLL
jgi:hypothetical protein